MSVPNIKSGFRKCGIHPFDPNAIDKSQLIRNRQIPTEDIDLSLPPEPVNSESIENGFNESQNEVEVATPENYSDPSARPLTIPLAQSIDVPRPMESAPESMNENAVIDISDTDLEIPMMEGVPEEDHHGTGLIDEVGCRITVEPWDLEQPIESTAQTIKSPDPCSKYPAPSSEPFAPSTNSPSLSQKSLPQMQFPASLNPLVTSGIIFEELAKVFYPPDEKIPQGRKRPLRTKSKARVMTDHDVSQNL